MYSVVGTCKVTFVKPYYYPKNPVSAPAAVGPPLCSGDKHRLFRLRTHMYMGGGAHLQLCYTSPVILLYLQNNSTLQHDKLN